MLKGMLEHSPFSFRDVRMETCYSQYFIETNYIRSRHVLAYFWIPVILPLRLSRCIYWILYPQEFDFLELKSAVFKFFIMAFSFLLVLRAETWGHIARNRLGLLQLWATRLLFMIAIFEQTRKDRNANIFFSLVFSIALGGFTNPRYSEYLAFAILISFARPAQLLISCNPSECSQIQEIAYQHALVLALCTSVHWTVHSDIRRGWLRSPALPVDSDRPGTCGVVCGQPLPPEDGWDLLNDDYFSHADQVEMRAQALQVSPARQTFSGNSTE